MFAPPEPSTPLPRPASRPAFTRGYREGRWWRGPAYCLASPGPLALVALTWTAARTPATPERQLAVAGMLIVLVAALRSAGGVERIRRRQFLGELGGPSPGTVLIHADFLLSTATLTATASWLLLAVHGLDDATTLVLLLLGPPLVLCLTSCQLRLAATRPARVTASRFH